MPDTWISRREFHPGAARLVDLMADPGCFLGGEVAIQPVRAAGSWTDSERLWGRFLTGGVRAPGFRLVRRGTKLSRRDYCRSAPVGSEQLADVAEPNRVLELYSSGATIVLQALQFTDRAYSELSTNLALELDQPIQVNAYLTPPGEQGLDVHFDFHDVAVVQLAGRKRWRVWAPLARTQRPLKRGSPIRQPTPDELGDPVLDRVLECGECLAVPRGFPHAAESDDVESVHLTIGIMALTWNRVLRDLIDQVAQNTALAERLPFGGLGSAASPAPDEAIATLAELTTICRLRHAVATEVWRRQPPTRLRSRRPRRVTLDQPLAVTPGPLLWLDAGRSATGKGTVSLGDRRLRFPAECTPFVAAILESPPTFTGAELGGGLDDESRVAVLSRLASEGVLDG